MTIQELQKNIILFFEGKLSDSEEQTLREYLATHDVPHEFSNDKRVILALVPNHSITIPDGMEERMSAFIDNLPDREQKNRPAFAPVWRWVSGIAAALILASAAGLYFTRQPSKPQLTEQEIYACAEAQRALLLVSQKLNKGMDQWQQANYEIVKTQRIINKYFKYE